MSVTDRFSARTYTLLWEARNSMDDPRDEQQIEDMFDAPEEDREKTCPEDGHDLVVVDIRLMTGAHFPAAVRCDRCYRAWGVPGPGQGGTALGEMIP